MTVSKINTLKTLIDSKDGQHLTAYLTNDHNIIHLKRRFRETLEQARECLEKTMKPEEVTRFLEPIRLFSEDTTVLRGLKGNVGVFRTESSFRVLSLPIPVENICIMASSFHIKPLLRWIQMDREFLILGLAEDSASLYVGTQSSLQLVDSVIFPEILQSPSDGADYLSLKAQRDRKVKLDQTMQWLSEWLVDMTRDAQPRLFVAGQSELTGLFFGECRYANTFEAAIWPSFSERKINEIVSAVRAKQRLESKTRLERLLMEFNLADDLKLANKNIFRIAKEAMRGRVKKLVIADDINIFGMIDRQTGGLAIHPGQLNNEDDDILDDLAQEVLARGGEVVVVERGQIPKGMSILAIFEGQESVKRERTV